MPYAIDLVQCNNTTDTVYRTGLAGFPTGDFDHLLVSMWVCLGPVPNNRIVNFVNSVVCGSISIDHTKVRVWFRPGQSEPISFDGNYATAPLNVVQHVLVSISPVAGHVQVYANDVQLELTSGGWTGGPVGPFNLTGFSQWELTAAGSFAPGPGVADLFAAAPATFFDLTETANRRKFITTDNTPVDLGADAASVLGTAPPVWLTARSGVAGDFAANGGTGGTFSTYIALSFLAPGSCILPTLPPRLALDTLLVTDVPPVQPPGDQVFLDWSEDRGHSYGNPVGQQLGPRGYYLRSLQWQRLAYARDRVYRLTWSVPVDTALQGAWIEADTKAKS